LANRTEGFKRIHAHQRYYLADGTLVPGVTTVLSVLAKPALVTWANRLGLEGVDVTKYVDKTANIGTLAHYLIECNVKAEEPDLEPFSAEEIRLARWALKSYRTWREANSPRYIASELQLVSERWHYGGTIDAIAVIGGKRWVVDFKTSKTLYQEHIIQVAAYLRLARENGYRVGGARVVRIGRTPEEGFEERVFLAKDLKKYWEIFRHALAIYRLKKELK